MKLLAITIYIFVSLLLWSCSTEQLPRDFTPVHDNMNSGDWIAGDFLRVHGMTYLVSARDIDLCDQISEGTPRPSYCGGGYVCCVEGDPYTFGLDDVNLCHLPVEIQPGYCGDLVMGPSGKYAMNPNDWPGMASE